MGELSQTLEERHELQAREKAISAFLYLGAKLRALYARERERSTATAEAPAQGHEALLRTIEAEIIPRLMLVHRAPAAGAASLPTPAPALDSEDHERFLDIVMHESAASTRRFVDGVLARGVSHEAVFLQLLSRAARRLGELWEEDLCDFADVTIGLCRLHEVLRELSVMHDERQPDLREAPRILLATACGDQHVFGVVMVAEFFRRAGWRVWSEPGAGRPQIAGLLGAESFDVLGLSAACDTVVSRLCEEIADYRRSSCNSGLRILVGGRLFVEDPTLVGTVGADGAANDAEGAPAAGRELLARSGTRC